MSCFFGPATKGLRYILETASSNGNVNMSQRQLLGWSYFEGRNLTPVGDSQKAPSVSKILEYIPFKIPSGLQ